MKVGIPLFLLRPEQLSAVACRAEALGFESVWVPEHVVLPTHITSRYPYSRDGVAPITPATPLFDPLIVLAQIAALTTRIRLGTSIYILPLRHPLIAARMAMTVDVLSGGRLSFGVGAGWLREEFTAAGIDFGTRAARLRESVRALKALWTQPEVDFRGRTYAFGPVRFEPKPLQKPHPPIIFGGESDAALARAAALGDGWYGVGHTPASAAAQIRKLQGLLATAERQNASFEITVSTASRLPTGDDVRRYSAAGVDRIVVLPWQRGREAEAALARLADAVLMAD